MTKADRTSVDLKLVDPVRQQRSVECLPSAVGEISALASAAAPFVSFDETAFCAVSNGVASVTLVTHRQIAQVPGQGVVSDRVITAHLRGSLQAMFALRETINTLEQLAMKQAEDALAAQEEAAATRLPN